MAKPADKTIVLELTDQEFNVILDAMSKVTVPFPLLDFAYTLKQKLDLAKK